MIRFARFAYFTLFRDAGFFGLAAALLMMAFSFSLPIAFDAGGTMMLLFAILLLLRVALLTEQRFQRSEAWSALDEDEKPQGYDGLIWARAELETMMLRFAKTAAGIAGLLYSSALITSVA
jgi:Ca2+/Na+ antiporter